MTDQSDQKSQMRSANAKMNELPRIRENQKSIKQAGKVSFRTIRFRAYDLQEKTKQITAQRTKLMEKLELQKMEKKYGGSMRHSPNKSNSNERKDQKQKHIPGYMKLNTKKEGNKPQICLTK